MSEYVSPRTLRRRAGRAIRRKRREVSEVVVWIQANWEPIAVAREEMVRVVAAALSEIVDAVVAATPHLVDLVAAAAACRVEGERQYRDWMLTYRALEAPNPSEGAGS